jgi:uncharacterized protein
VIHSFQTNGTLISDAWCELFKDYKVSIGLSIDGPEGIHDSNRKYWSGRGSYSQCMRGYSLLQKHGIKAGAICVLTWNSLNYPDEIYDFFRDLKLNSLGFNVDETEGENLRSSLVKRPKDEVIAAYRAFMRRLWRRWRDDHSLLNIREFAHELTFIHALILDPGYTRTPAEVIPFGIVSIQKDGRISTFSPELASTVDSEYENFVIGNVLVDSPDDVQRRDVFTRIAREVAQGRAACQMTCPYFSVCGGGFQSNRMAEHGSFLATETMTCRLQRQTLTDVLVDELSKESQASAEKLTGPAR